MTYSTQLLGGLSVATWLAAGAALADDYTPLWIGELTYQLERDVQCDVSYYIRAKDYGEGGFGYVEARAKCEDGREFDAFRENRFDDFTIIQCANAVCEQREPTDSKNPA